MTRPSDREVLLLIASELDEARTQIETLGSVLCGIPELVRVHVRQLQTLDHVAQRCASIAAILRSDDVLGAGRAAKLESIASRLLYPSCIEQPGDSCFF